MVCEPHKNHNHVLISRRYVLSPTHIHEFKSADRIYTQPPVMSLYLPDQKLGSKSQPGSSSHKFVIKGRQAGSMHRGHTWVFRAESYETMQAWYDDIKTLTEKTGEERNAFVRRHASVRSRSASAASARSASSDGGLEEDEADAIPFSTHQSMKDQSVREPSPRPSRPSPGGRFPSDLIVNRNLQAPLSPSSGSSEVGHDLNSAAGGPNQDVHPMYLAQSSAYQPLEPVQPAQYAQPVQQQQEYPAASYVNAYPPTQGPYPQQAYDEPAYHQQAYESQPAYPSSYAPALESGPQAQPSYAQPTGVEPAPIQRHDSNNYGNWMAPAAGGAAAGALAGEAYHRKEMEQHEQAQQHEIDEKPQPENGEQHYTAQQSQGQGLAGAQYQELDYPVAQPFATGPVGSPPAIPERDPDHIAPDVTSTPVEQATIPAPIVAARTIEQTQPHQESTASSSSSTTETFLAESEVGTASASGKTVNGGPVPVELVETAATMAHPGIYRQNTDISVSDLHVPGEYPKAKFSEPTFLRYS